MNIYYIGGSPCAGKSSVAEILSQKYGLYYFKVDDYLDRYIQAGAQRGYPICRKIVGMNTEQIWMREPRLQCKEAAYTAMPFGGRMPVPSYKTVR